MSNLSDATIRVDLLPKEKFVIGKKNEKGETPVYLTIQISTSDETNQFGQNVTVTVPQTKEERDAKKPKSYLGNGKVFWTDGNIKLADKKQEVSSKELVEDSLPF
jgi:hypothetical protein